LPVVSGDQLPLVTVAVLSYNRREALAVNLGKLSGALDYPAERLEVIVVDNASTDGTADMVRERFPHVRLIANEENTGIAGWNRAFEAGSGEWFLVLDDDCYVEGDALRCALAAAVANAADLVSFTVDSSEAREAFSEFYEPGLMLFWGCSALLSRRALNTVGGFDPGLFIWAHEVEWTMRFYDAGLRHLHLPEVHSVHMKPLPRMTEFNATRNLRNFGYVVAKLLQPADAAVALPNLLVKALIEAVRYPGHHVGLLAVVSGFREGLRHRRPVRPVVSRLYRRHYLEFSSAIQLWPRLRYVLMGSEPGTDFQHAYWRARPRLYPRSAAAIRVP
jgi:GT2 family glycosyltransferase